VPEFLKTMWSHFRTDQSTASIDRIVVEGEEAVALGTFSHVANTTGRRFTTPVAMHLTVRDGRIVRVHLYEDTYAVARAFRV
jgi:ketosteroid isomerase-like protein